MRGFVCQSIHQSVGPLVLFFCARIFSFLGNFGVLVFFCFVFGMFEILNIEYSRKTYESSLQCIVGSSFLSKNACQWWINAERDAYSRSSIACCEQPKQMTGQPQNFKRWSGFLYLFSVKRLVKCNRTKPACFFRKFPSNCWFRQTIRVFYCPLCAPMYLYVIV